MSSNTMDEHRDITARAVANRRPVPEIDFSLHTMEDGTQVSTQERVVKGKVLKIDRLTVEVLN